MNILTNRAKIATKRDLKNLNENAKPKRERGFFKISFINEKISFIPSFIISFISETPINKGFKANYKRLNEIFKYNTIYVFYICKRGVNGM